METSLLTREQLLDRLAALHRASLELVSDISIDSLIERIAHLAREQVGARYAAVGILDENGNLARFIPVGMSHEEIARMAHPPKGLGLIGALMRGTQSIRLARISNDPRSVGFPPHHPPMESFLGVPIRHADQNLGQIYLTDKIDAPEFTADDQAVIEMLAAYAGVALANARLLQKITQREAELTRRNENLALLNEMASTLATSSDVRQILGKALEQLMDYLDLEVGEIYLREDDSPFLNLCVHQGEAVPHLWLSTSFRLGDGIVGNIALAQTPRIIDLARPQNPAETETFHPALLESDVRYLACFPLQGRTGTLGVLCAGINHTLPFDELETQFLSAISFWVSTALENTYLNVQQRRLAVLEERERIGMDLHDGIIQDIYAVGLTLEHARLLMNDDPEAARQRIDQAITDLNNTIRDIRAYILDLRPRKLHEENLMDGLRRLVAEFRANTQVEVQLQAIPNESINLPQPAALALFHICQEALANIAKHAHARHVSITLWTSNQRTLLEINDDGVGFDVSKTRQVIGHGLANMQTRAHQAGGEIEFSSEPGNGTTILVWVPNR
ncbi:MULTISPECIES: GAF domain-containing sensor histidine kinase [Anaerolinea]|uniref:sensor histidine kinase n=1 Tax=Anaerolinea TaxID=233189 RepID=UPI002628766D|nr:GAF domain-containing sensor histidine kinase [Anaerolinea thermophila]